MKKKAIITGAASGIGRASAMKLAKNDLELGLIDFDTDHLEALAKELRQEGTVCYYRTADVSSESELNRAVRELTAELGSLDIFFCNAGINGTWTPIEEMTLTEWQKTIDTNLTSTFLTLRAAIPHLKEKGGSVIITSSINGNRIFNNFGASAYSSSKAGQVALMKMAALELARYNIRVNAVCPGQIDTHIEDNMTIAKEVEEIEIAVEFPEGERPLKDKTNQPEQVAELVAFLASDAAGNISGTEIYIDGAESLL